MSASSDPVGAWIAAAPEPQRSQLRALRDIVRSAAPDAAEAMKWARPCYTRKTLLCYLHRAKSHVTLGFYQGARMADPAGRLVGSGTQLRHVRFAPDEPIDAALCKALIREAVRLE
jgi:hypothetical protein